MNTKTSTSNNPLTGLLLGAGASYEIGIPLVWDLTSELRKFLTPEKLTSLNNSWRLHGTGYPDEVINELITALNQLDLHYENILGRLETKFRTGSQFRQEFHGLYSWLVQLVGTLIYDHHMSKVDYIKSNLRFYNGISFLASRNNPLWVFSLNHDVIIECIAMELKIPINSGFPNDVVTLPRRKKSGEIIGQLKASVISGDVLQNSNMPFFNSGTNGINLLKIHGSLDIFTFREGQDLLKILPLEQSVDGVIASLRTANEELIHPDMNSANGKVNAVNEIAYSDDANVMQFLRRSLLAGAYKFTSKFSQVLPVRILDNFKFYINNLSSLICIGYSFGDNHINQVILDWLDNDGQRRLEIVRPTIAVIPTVLQTHADQVTISSSKATEYFDSIAGIVRGKRELLEKRLAALRLKFPDKTVVTDALQKFITENQKEKAELLGKWVSTLPVLNGDIDLVTLGMTQSELNRKGLEIANSSYEDVLESFLNSVESLPTRKK